MKLQFNEWVATLSQKYKQSQIKAAYKVNTELIKFYFELGKEINDSSFKKEYGNNFYAKLGDELKKMLPNTKGFSPQNLRYIESFYILYRKIFQQVVGKFEKQGGSVNNSLIDNNNVLLERMFLIPWGHYTIILNKFKDNPEVAWFYINKIIENNWSRSSLENYIDANLHKREGQSINNFLTALPDAPISVVTQLSKDPVYFDYAELREDYDEKELKKSLVNHIRDFLLELGTGFSFVGQEYRIHVGESDFYIDLLFYNIRLHAYVVIEIKTTKFKPEYLGQLNFYVAAVNHDIKGDEDNKTIGLLICKDKDGVVAKYSLDNCDAPLGISSYDLARLLPEDISSRLPSIEELENEVKKKKK